MLILNDLSLRIAGRLLIDHASLTLPAGSKAGLVGRNGTGKTTLFRAISGDLSAETGTISMPKSTRIGQVAQEAPGTDEPLIEIVLKADAERAALLEEERMRPTPTGSPRFTRGSPTSTPIRLRRAPPPSWPGLASTRRRRSAPPPRFPAAGACASRSPRCCSRSPTCCSSTSPPTISTSKALCGSRTTWRATRTPC